MSVLRSGATVQFEAEGVAAVAVSVRLKGGSRIYCHLYEGSAPVLSVIDEHVRISVSVPDPDQVTEDDAAGGRLLAEAVARYVAELERLAATDRPTTGPGEPSGRAA